MISSSWQVTGGWNYTESQPNLSKQYYGLFLSWPGTNTGVNPPDDAWFHKGSRALNKDDPAVLF